MKSHQFLAIHIWIAQKVYKMPLNVLLILGIYQSLPILNGQSYQAIHESIFNGNADIWIRGGDITLSLPKPEGGVFTRNIRIGMVPSGAPSVVNERYVFSTTWSNGLAFAIRQNHTTNSNVRVFQTELKAPFSQSKIEQCETLGDANWYGGAENSYQPWPIQDQPFSNVPFIPNDQYGGPIERLFLSSQGSSYFVYENVPLFITLDPVAKSLCFCSEFAFPYQNTEHRDLLLPIYQVYGRNMLESYKHSLATFFNRPLAIPSEDVFRNPIWSTWAMYKENITQDIVLDFSNQIIAHKFPISQIEIDDNWESCYGEEEFDLVKFPNPSKMVADLAARGHKVTVWVHPFVNANCKRFAEGDNHKYFVTTDGNNVTGKTQWWRGDDSALIDVTNKEATAWWQRRLEKLRTEVGIASFKFDAGESYFLPKKPYLYASEDLQPGIYSTDYALFANRFGDRVESRIGYRSGNVSIFIRMLDRHSAWDLHLGLHSVITSALHIGLIGAPFVLPDYIGGNGYGTQYPDRELFIRWVELTAFLPVMQFSITPWSYDEEVVSISRKMVALHIDISDVIIAAAKQATVDGSPIIRALWWLDPKDVTTHVINDQFVVGDTYLVAPIIKKGSTSRNIYIPIGNWSDELRGGTVIGPGWLVDYSVALEEISYFKII